MAQHKVFLMLHCFPVTIGAGGGGSGGLIDSGTFSAASTVDIDLPDGYTTFKLEYYLEKSATSEILYVVTRDGFSTVENGASDYAWVLSRYAGSFGGARDNLDTDVNTVGGTSSEDYNIGNLDILHAKESTCPTRIKFETDYDNGSPAMAEGWGDYIGTNDAINGIRIAPSAGTITGLWRLYGM